MNVFVALSAFLYLISKKINSYETIVLGRFVSGVVSGLLTGVVPIYVNEISPINLRYICLHYLRMLEMLLFKIRFDLIRSGSVGTMNQVIAVAGKLSSNIAGLPSLLGTAQLWPVLTGIVIFPSFFHIGLFFLTDSPKFLFAKSKEAARQGFSVSFYLYFLNHV